MIAPEYEQLIQDVLDGVATPQEAARLETWLRTSEEGRARQRELTSLFAKLARVPLTEAPPDLARSTLADIRERGASRATGNPFLASWRVQMMRRPALTLAMPFAAGLAAGVLVFGAWAGWFAAGSTRGRADTAASMAPAAGAASETWTLGSSEFRVRSWNAGGSRFASIDVSGSSPFDLALSFDPKLIQPVGLHQSPGSVEASVSPGGIALKSRGEGSYVLEFRPVAPEAPIRVTMRLFGEEGAPQQLVGILPSPGMPSPGR